MKGLEGANITHHFASVCLFASCLPRAPCLLFWGILGYPLSACAPLEGPREYTKVSASTICACGCKSLVQHILLLVLLMLTSWFVCLSVYYFRSVCLNFSF